jgi:hypothetical protein
LVPQTAGPEELVLLRAYQHALDERSRLRVGAVEQGGGPFGAALRSAELSRAGEGGAFGPGAEVTRTAYFLQKRIDYVLRVEEYAPPVLLDMKSVAGPMPMHVTYRFDEHPEGTLASIRVRGDASGYYRLAGPLMAPMVRRSLGRDLRDLHRRLAPGR